MIISVLIALGPANFFCEFGPLVKVAKPESPNLVMVINCLLRCNL